MTIQGSQAGPNTVSGSGGGGRRPSWSTDMSGWGQVSWYGGTAGSGAPRGNQNALKHGRYTSERRESRALRAAFHREMRAWLRERRKTR
jgi:hypothetical protein